MNYNKTSFSLSKEIFLCDIHPNNPITHLCCLEDCLTAICSKCMKDHNLYHKEQNTFPELEAIDDVKEFCVEKIEFLIRNCDSEFERIENLDLNDLIKEDPTITKIKKFRDKLLQIINEYFVEIVNEYQNFSKRENDEILGLVSNKENLNKIRNNLKRIYDDYNEEPTIDELKNILMNDYSDKLEEIKKNINNTLDNFILKKSYINIDETRINNILKEIKFMIDFRNKEETSKMYLKKDESDLNFSEEQKIISVNKSGKNKTNNSYIEKKDYSSNSINLNKNYKSSPKQFNSNEEIIDFQIKTNDYYNFNINKKFLHFFQQKNAILHLFYLEDLDQNFYKPLKIQLSINFKIPRWHRSISLPNGDIYLTGGVISQKITHSKFSNDIEQEKTSNNVFIFDFEKTTLIPLSNMNYSRSGHGIAYLNNKIFVVGGLTDENNYSKTCEQYDIENNYWSEIAELNYKVNNCCLSPFKNKYLYKFGGKIADKEINNWIERYSIINNKWTLIDVKIFDPKTKISRFSLLSSSAGCQINKNQIFIFGGTLESYSKKSDESYIFEINEKENSITNYFIKGINERKLPSAEGFWNNNPIIYNNSLYCLQNIPNENNLNIVYNDRRKILRYNFNEGWIALN